jgi:hypothetical protein
MAIKSVLSMRVVSSILIVVAFLLGRFTAPRSGGGDRPPLETVHPDSMSPAKMAIPPGQPVIGFLDMVDGKPLVGAKRDSNVQVSGWAACVDADSPLVKVEVVVDDGVIANAFTSYPRSDVAEAYDRSDFVKSGWKASVSTDQMGSGQHALKARVTCAKGESGELPAFSLNIADR